MCVRLYTAVTMSEELEFEGHWIAADELLGASKERFADGNDSGAVVYSDEVVNDGVDGMLDSLGD